ncbi:MAG TPA: cupin domain-containing protein [Variovorax sp.]|nr:cupin domain-containing protein [Variovorax sp.]
MKRDDLLPGLEPVPLARAHADERLQLEGWDTLALLLGDPKAYFELERDRRAVLLSRRHRLLDFDRDALWRLVDTGRLDIAQHQLRMVRADADGFDCLDAAAYAGPDGRLADTDKVRRCFEEGATLVVQLLDRFEPRFGRLCTGLSATLGHPCQISAYLTPPGARGLDIHHDWHDVFVLQIEGTKQFRTYEPVLARPLNGMSLNAGALREMPPTTRPLLGPSDVLYLPRGVPHAADAGGDGSLHLSLGVLAITWASLLAELAGEMYFAPPLAHNVAARMLYRPIDLDRAAVHAVEGLCGWLRDQGAQRLAALAALRFVQSFGTRPPLSPDAAPPAMAIEPSSGGGLLLDPKGSRRLDADALRDWMSHHPSDEQWQEDRP